MSARHYQTRRPAPDTGRGDPWQDRAACLGHEATFDAAMSDKPKHPTREEVAAQAEAALICAGCEVREMCLKYALETNQQVGVWGGTTPEQRATLRHKRYRGPDVPPIALHPCPGCARPFPSIRGVASHYAQVHTPTTGTCYKGHPVAGGPCIPCKRGSDSTGQRNARKREAAKLATLQGEAS